MNSSLLDHEHSILGTRITTWRALRRSVLLACWATLAGCAVGVDDSADIQPPEPESSALKSGAPPADDDAGLNPLAHVETSAGTRVSFYEPIPGYGILVTETANNEVEPVYKRLSSAGYTPLESFAELVPDQPLPETLSAAQSRYEELMARGVSEAKSLAERERLLPTSSREVPVFRQPAQAPGLHTQAFTGVQNGCTLQQMQSFCTGSSSWFVCNLNMRNNSSYQRDDSITYSEEVCVFTSSWVRWRVKFRTWWSWSTYGDFTVLGGTMRYVNNDGIFDFDVSSEVYDVVPDGYHQVASGARLF